MSRSDYESKSDNEDFKSNDEDFKSDDEDSDSNVLKKNNNDTEYQNNNDNNDLKFIFKYADTEIYKMINIIFKYFKIIIKNIMTSELKSFNQ